VIALGHTRATRRSKLKLRAPRNGAGNRWRSNAKASPPQPPGTLGRLGAAPRGLARVLGRLAGEARTRSPALFGQIGARIGGRISGPTRGTTRELARQGGDQGARSRLPTAPLVGAALAIVAASLTIVALRSDLTHVRYQLSQASAELRQLDEEGRALTLELRKLHDPRRLGEIAKARGFGPPERVVELP